MNAIRKLNEQSFVEDKNARDQYILRTDVLNKVKLLSMLPDGEHMTIRQVSSYYDVEVESVRKVIQRNKQELTEDGLKTLLGQDFQSYRSSMGQNVLELKSSPSATLLNKRSILRIGMLLRDSDVAKQVRAYLLNVEETSTREQKEHSVNRTNGWTTEEDLILMDSIYNIVGKGGKLKDAASEASDRTGRTIGACQTRYNGKLKVIISDKNIFSNIKSNQGNQKHNLSLVTQSTTIKEITPVVQADVVKDRSNDIILSKLENIDVGMIAFYKLHNTRLDKLVLENEKLKKEKMDLSLQINKIEYKSILNDMVYKENLKDIQSVLDVKDIEMKKYKKLATEYKTRLKNVKELLSPKPLEKGKSKPSIQSQSERTGKNFKIVDGVPKFSE